VDELGERDGKILARLSKKVLQHFDRCAGVLATRLDSEPVRRIE